MERQQAGWRGEEKGEGVRAYNAAFYGPLREAAEVKTRLYSGEAWWVGVEVRLSILQYALIRQVPHAMRSGSQKPKVARRGTRSRGVANVIGKPRPCCLSLHVTVLSSSLHHFVKFISSRFITTIGPSIDVVVNVVTSTQLTCKVSDAVDSLSAFPKIYCA